MRRILASLAVVALVGVVSAAGQETDKRERDLKRAMDVPWPSDARRPATPDSVRDVAPRAPKVGPSIVTPPKVRPPREAAPPEVRRRIEAARPEVRRPVRVARPERKRMVVRLSHAPASEVARLVEGLLKAEQQDRSGVVILADPITNSIVLSGPPKAIEETTQLIAELDRAPQMVSIRLMIAQISPAEVKPDDDDASDISPEEFFKALQGGKKNSRLRVISRPHIMTLNNEPAFLRIGHKQPVLRGSTAGRTGGQARQISTEGTGLVVAVTPRVNDQGQVVMEIDVEQSRLGSDEDGVVVSATADGKKARQPNILNTYLQTTVRVDDGQTIVLGGLGTESDSGKSELLITATVKIMKP